MPKYYKIKGETLTNIADAIREKIGNGGGQITPLGMPDKIASIDGGGTEITDGIVVKARNSSGRITEVDYYGSRIFDNQFRSGQASPESWLPFSYLEKVDYKDTITSIGAHAFSCCNNLKKIVIPPTVTEIGEAAFRYAGTSAITDAVYMPPENFKINDYIFAYSKITKFYDKYSHNYATGTPHSHQYCTRLTDVQLGSVGYPCLGVEAGTFYGCTQLGLTITAFTTGANVDGFVSRIRSGATNATIIIKASEETEYNGTTYQAGDTILTSEVTS